MTPSGGRGVLAGFGPELADSTLFVRTIFPEGPAALVLFSRDNRAGRLYQAVYTESAGAELLRSNEMVANGSAPTLFDGQPHIFALHTKQGSVTFGIDDKPVLEWRDPDPLPPGGFAVQAVSGVVWVDELLVCAYPEGAAEGEPPGGEPFFKDDFEGERLKEGWDWINQPPDGWRLEGGRLTIGVLPQTSMVTELDVPLERLNLGAPALVRELTYEPPFAVQVDVQVTPTRNFQGAGLILLNQRRQPFFSLMRTFCDTPDICQGDAIYFDNWGMFAQSRDTYRAHRAGAGELPPDGVVSLRLVLLSGSVAGFYSVDGGREWRLVGESPLIVEERLGFAGLVTANGGQPNDPIPAFFDNFVILPDGLP
jgi:hypothetical protein